MGTAVQHSISLFQSLSQRYFYADCKLVGSWEKQRPDSRHGVNSLIQTEEEPCPCTDIQVCTGNTDISEEVQVFFYQGMCWILTWSFMNMDEGELTYCGVSGSWRWHFYKNNQWHFHRNFTPYCSLHNGSQPGKSFTFVILHLQCLAFKSSGTGMMCIWAAEKNREDSSEHVFL